MIGFRWSKLDPLEREVFQVSLAFLDGRMDRPETLLWALDLADGDVARQAATLEALDRTVDTKLAEPWLLAWRLMEESWLKPVPNRPEQHMEVARISERLRRGDRSATVIDAIVDLVRPRLSLAPAGSLQPYRRKWKPKRIGDLLRGSLTSGELINPSEIDLDAIKDSHFLAELMNRLDDALQAGEGAARRFGWNGRDHFRLGLPDRVAFIEYGSEHPQDVDEFRTGLTPSLKLLYGVVSCLADLDLNRAAGFVEGIKHRGTRPYDRLWAALACDSRLASSASVADALAASKSNLFWEIHDYPEFSELRARRFGDLAPKLQSQILARIRRGPPRGIWPKAFEPDRFEEMSRYWRFREFRRIQIAGWDLPPDYTAWLTQHVGEFPSLAESQRIDEGFTGGYHPETPPQPSDDGYNLLGGRERLERLERALVDGRTSWEEDPSDRAIRWISDPRNYVSLIQDMEIAGSGGADFASVWERFGWRHRPEGTSGDGRDINDEGRRVLKLIQHLEDDAIEAAIDGLSHWLSDWRNQVAHLPDFPKVWKRLWPIAVARANRDQPEDGPPLLNIFVQSADESDPKDLDTYNTAAGKLVGAFLALCPNLTKVVVAFPQGEPQTEIREILAEQSGRAGLIARHRLTEHLSYFMKADPAWTRQTLLPLLTENNSAALALWNAATRSALTSEILEHLAPEMLRRAVDTRLSRETRRRVAFRLAADALHAYYDKRALRPAAGDLQGMIRALDDEVRAFVAGVCRRFLKDVSISQKVEPEKLFDAAIRPFLVEIWPQERSLATLGVSKAFADMPVAAGDRFADAVVAVERFLVPFDCWSIMDYGLYGDDETGQPRLKIIDDATKAAAFLRLLDATIGTNEGAVVPHDLSAALHRIRAIAPQLAHQAIFRRLATAARL